MAPQKYYTVGVSNPFSAFGGGHSSGDESSGDEVILAEAPHRNEEVTATPPRSSAKESLAHSKEKQASPAAVSQGSRPQRPAVARPARGGGRGGRRSPLAREGSDYVPNDGKPSIGSGHQKRRGGRGRGDATNRGREFDRHSASARPRDSAKSGGGGHNWGKDEGEVYPKEVQAGESTPEVQDGVVVEEDVADENAKRQDDTIDFETYKMQLMERRANLPTFSQGTSAKTITTGKELEAQGYKVHVKENVDKDAHDDAHAASVSGDEHDMRKKKAMNVFEYIHHEGGRVQFFQQRRGRGGGKPNGRRSERGSSDRLQNKQRSAPNIEDTGAFPSLGGQ